MQQRQYRPGDVLDDYCPRERRITDHAVVAMVDDDVQRTRCVVCEAEHEFKNARVPTQRKKTTKAALFTQVLDNLEAPATRLAAPGAAAPPEPSEADPAPVGGAATETEPGPIDVPAPPGNEASDDRPFRRSLIRAQLPRPEGQPPPQRAIPEFTMHQPLNQRGKRAGGGRFRRRPMPGNDAGAGPMRFGAREQGNGQGGRRRRRKKH